MSQGFTLPDRVEEQRRINDRALRHARFYFLAGVAAFLAAAVLSLGGAS